MFGASFNFASVEGTFIGLGIGVVYTAITKMLAVYSYQYYQLREPE